MQTVQSKGSGKPNNLILLIAAFAAVYLIWGSTYLAIKYAIGTIPSFLMAGVRFSVAGIILLVWARLSPGYTRPKAVHWRTAIIVGALLLGLGNGGVVIANPIPEESQIPSGDISPVIDKALTAAKKKGIAGKETTPFLLKHLVDATKGKSLKANIALVENNAKVAAQIAAAYSQKR